MAFYCQRMGVLRFLLAVAVLAHYSAPIVPGVPMLDGNVAVEGFFIISGFYMALILSGPYVGRPAEFYAARALRIYPMYWIVLAAAVAGLLWRGGRLEVPAMDLGTMLFVVASNLLLFGQDVMQFLRVGPDGALALDLSRSDIGATLKLLPVPQAWTLALELTFYAFAPWLARLQTRWLIALALASFALRQLGLYFGFWGAWTYYFFPMQLGFFVAGMISYRAYRAIGAIPASLGVAALLVVSAMTFMGDVPRISTMFYAALVLCLPAIFEVSKTWRWDDAIGQLSYPIYLCHLAVIEFLSGPYPPLALAASVAVSIALIFATAPVERMRLRLRRGSTR